MSERHAAEKNSDSVFSDLKVDEAPGFLFVDHIAIAVLSGELENQVRMYKQIGFRELHREKIEDRDVWKMELTALVDDINYFKRILWVDKERYVPIKEDLFAKSGELLKRISFYNFKKTDGRWYPRKINYRDMLKNGKGTDFIINEIKFNVSIPDQYFLKSTLKE